MIDLTPIKAVEFDIERELFLGKDSQLVLLKSDGETKEYQTVGTVETGWNATFSEFFGMTTFKVARGDEAFTEWIEESSHVLIANSSNAALNNQLHEINRQTTIPAGVEPFWRIRATAKGQKYIP